MQNKARNQVNSSVVVVLALARRIVVAQFSLSSNELY